MTEDLDNHTTTQNDTSNLVDLNIAIYRRRWYIIAVYSALAFMQCCLWNTWGPIMQAAFQVFPTWNDFTLSSLTTIGMISCVFSMPFYCYSLDRFGTRPCIIVMAACMAVGSALRCITIQEGFFTCAAFLCALLNGFAGVMALAAPPYISALWFAPSQRTTATSIPNILNQLGLSGSFFFGPLIVQQPDKNKHFNITFPNNISTSNLSLSYMFTNSSPSNGSAPSIYQLEADIMTYLKIEALICIVLLFMVLIYFPSYPPTPPSLSAGLNQRTSLSHAIDLKQAFKNTDLVLIMLTYSLSQGVMGGWFGVIDINLTPLGVLQDDVSNIGLIAGLSGCIFAFLVARFTDLIHGHLKLTIFILLIGGCANWSWLLAIVNRWAEFSLGNLYISVTLAVCCTYACSPLLFEYAAEVGFPLREDMIGCFLSFHFNVVAMLYLCLFMVNYLASHIVWLNYCLVISTAIPIVLLLFTQPTYTRYEFDRIEDTEGISSAEVTNEI